MSNGYMIIDALNYSFLFLLLIFLGLTECLLLIESKYNYASRQRYFGFLYIFDTNFFTNVCYLLFDYGFEKGH